MAKVPLATKGAPTMDIRTVVDRATNPNTPPRDLVGKGGLLAPINLSSPRDERELSLTSRESKDFSQALEMWLLGEELGGREMPDQATQKLVRTGLVDTLLGQRS